MKIVSEKEAIEELNKILKYDIDYTEYNPEEFEEISNDALLVKEYVGLSGELNDITLDTQDIKQILNNKDLLVMSVFEYSGLNSAQEVIKSIILDFEENQLSLIESDGILVCFQINSNYPMMEISDAIDIICDKLNSISLFDEPDVIFGTSCDDSLKDDYTKATIFMGYPKNKFNSYVNNFIKQSPLL